MNNFDLLVESLLVFWSLDIVSGTGGLLSDQKHRTQKAAEKANELLCYECQTMDINQSYCMNVSENDVSIQSKCEEKSRICMVKRVSFAQMGENSTIGGKTWSLERNCTNRCEPGCIVIGERNKIHVCWTCCDTSFCNAGTGKSSKISPTFSNLPMFTFLLYILSLQIFE